MKHISILVPEGALLGNVEGPRQLFSCVNDFLASQSREPIFTVELVGLHPDTSLNNGKYTVRPDRLIGEVDRTDLIIVPAVDGDLKRAVELNSGYIPWIIQQYKNGAEVASLCVGAFLLAATGLLNGRKCATHWMFADQFRAMYPDVNLVVEKIITDENGLYSSGGAFSYLNLILYLIEKYASRDLAIACAKVFQIDIDRQSQSPFIIFKGQKDHEDETVLKAQEFIEKNFQEKITVDQLASMLALGRRNLERRFKKATSNTVVEYIQRVKIEAAKMRLETSRENVNEVMYKVGYTDTKAFRTTFKKITGMSPLQYKVKYSHRAS
ncbi:MAG: helix-turn-helix domain-containing protein [Bacteroidota bacterium]|jgi:transcriptional regulator GlxA family with amidase domain|nr:MAG: AraC family transcriptional regulator [Bacteroidota bacterium]